MSVKQEKATAPIRTMQPHPDMDKLLDSPDFDPTQWVWERKFDGVRCLYDPSTQECYSRNGTLYKNFDFLKDTLNILSKYLPEGVVFDGEVSGMQFKDTTEQLFRKTAADTSGLVYNVFDIILPKYTLDERKSLLWDSVVKAVQERGRIFCKQVQLVYSFDFPLDFTKDKLIAMLTNLVKYDGFEGIVLKNKQSKYEPGKKAITSWVKGLIQHTEDLVVTGVVEGKGKLAGCVGKFICGDYKIAPGKATHAQLKHWWEHQEDMPKIIEVSYKSSTGKSLRHPRFVRARYDK